MSGNVSTFLRISRLANKFRDRAKSEGRSQLLEPKGLDKYEPSGSTNSYLAIYAGYPSIPEDLTISFVSSLAKTSTSSRFEIPRKIVYIIFYRYNLFCY